MAPRFSQVPFAEQVENARGERGWSLRQLAQRSGADIGFLSRALRRAENKRPSLDLMQRVGAALEIPPETFPEFRELAVVEWVAQDAAARDETFRRLQRRRAHPSGLG